MITFTKLIKGTEWKINILSEKKFRRKHREPEFRDAGALCLSIKQIDFINTELNFTTIIHELGHAYKYESHTDASELDPNQTEEQMCQIYSENFFQLLKLASEIIEEYNKLNE